MEDAYVGISFLARLLVGLAFLAAGLSKSHRPERLLRTLEAYAALPPWARSAVGRWLPPLEVALGLAIILGVASVASAVFAVVLLLGFTGLSVSVLRAGRVGGCSCGLMLDGRSAGVLAARNAVLAGVAALPLALGSGPPSLDASLLQPGGLLIVVAATLFLLRAARPATAASEASDDGRIGEGAPSRMGRRSFLRKAGAFAGGFAAATLVGIRQGHRAEAACYGCDSCYPAYYWISCTADCCAAYWVQLLEYCTPSCYPCGWWSIRIFCGIPVCC